MTVGHISSENKMGIFIIAKHEHISSMMKIEIFQGNFMPLCGEINNWVLFVPFFLLGLKLQNYTIPTLTSQVLIKTEKF